jgi:hypothetical protein
VLTVQLAIEYIKNLGRAHELTRAENARLRPDAEFCRRAQEENELLRNELSTVWQHLRRVEPGNAHVYGQAQVQQAQPPQWGTQAATAMQGVEFGGMRPYEHSHR